MDNFSNFLTLFQPPLPFVLTLPFRVLLHFISDFTGPYHLSPKNLLHGKVTMAFWGFLPPACCFSLTSYWIFSPSSLLWPQESTWWLMTYALFSSLLLLVLILQCRSLSFPLKFSLFYDSAKTPSALWNLLGFCLSKFFRI